jgi:hypothetical protein
MWPRPPLVPARDASNSVVMVKGDFGSLRVDRIRQTGSGTLPVLSPVPLAANFGSA